MAPNLHTVWMSAGLLAVRCKSCRHGKIFDNTTMPDIHRGNMTEIHTLKFKCDKCGSKDFQTYIPRNREQAEAFIAGAEPDTWGS